MSASLFLVVQFLIVAPLQAKDVTAQVIRETDLDERVAEACRKYCQGNRRKGWLKQITVVRIDQQTFKVRADASLRNRQYQDLSIGGGIQVYSYTIDVEAYGTLDARSCDLRVDRIKIINDRLGLGRLARGQEGAVHKVANCHRFLAGL